MVSHEELYKALEKRHGQELQSKISNTTVAICGLGGLGSNVSIALARVGIGKLILVDFDEVDVTNIHRQQYRFNQIGSKKTEALRQILADIAPYVEIVTYNTKITEENYKDIVGEADIVCEAFDNAESKAMLVNNVLENFPKKYVVSASGMAGMASANLIKTRKITNHFFLCGDEKTDVANAGTLFASRVMVCAAQQAHVIVQIISGNIDLESR